MYFGEGFNYETNHFCFILVVVYSHVCLSVLKESKVKKYGKKVILSSL